MLPKEDLNDVKKHLKAAKGFDLYPTVFFFIPDFYSTIWRNKAVGSAF